MPPQQPTYSPPQVTSGSYDFILSNNRRPGSGDWLTNQSMKTRALLVGGSFLVLLIIGWIFMAVITAKPASTAKLSQVVAQQQEIARVAQGPITNALSFSTRNIAVNASLSLLSDQQLLLKYLKTVGITPSPTTITSDKNPTTDSTLDTAKANGTYDTTYIATIQRQLGVYANTVKQIYQSDTVPAERTLLKNSYDHAQLLIAQSNQQS
jgi:hypothetical protein